MKDFPKFRYFPDPLGAGSFEQSDQDCECCGLNRGLLFTGAIYSANEIESVCPWCIASGELERKFGATLNDDHPLRVAGLPDKIIHEVTSRTPGYISWQQDEWLACCQDACEYHGEPSQEELDNLSEEGIQSIAKETGFALEVVRNRILHPDQNQGMAFYKFICRHCNKTMVNFDCE